MQEKYKSALQDILAGILNWRIWLLLAWQDIRLRYRRSQLGPFWLTLSMAITTYSMGFLYGKLFKIDLQFYFPFLAAGMLTWGLIVNIINESAQAMVEGGGYLKQIQLPAIVFILRIVTRNVVIFFHNVLAVVPIFLYFHVPIGWHTLFVFVGLFIIMANGLFFGLILSMLGARFRDIGQVVVSLMQVIFFITPVMWVPRVLPAQFQFIVKYNPFAQFVDLMRAPLMGKLPGFHDYLVTVSLTAIGALLMFLFYSRMRHRIVYWL